MRVYETATTFDLPDERVWVTGDWHGNAGWVGTLLPAMHRHDPSIRTILQLRDYGFPHGDADAGVHTVDYWAGRTGIDRVLITLGNHEDWPGIVTAQAEVPGHAIRVSEAVWLLPRPYRLRIGGRDVLSLGGASSIDKRFRTPSVDWHEDELITAEMENAAIARGPADVLLTHEAPVAAAAEVIEVLNANPRDTPPDALAVSAGQRERVQHVWDATGARLHMHGHMHVSDSARLTDGRRTVSLGRDTFPGHAAILDLETLKTVALSHDEIRGRQARQQVNGTPS